MSVQFATLRRILSHIRIEYILIRVFIIVTLSIFQIWSHAQTTDIGAYNLQFSCPNYDVGSGTFCIDIQIQSADTESFFIGDYGIWGNFDASVLNNMSYTPLAFAPNISCDDGGSSPYNTIIAESMEDVFIIAGTIPLGGVACNIVDTEWISIGTLCFDVLDIGEEIALSFDEGLTDFFNEEGLAHTPDTFTDYSPELIAQEVSVYVGDEVALADYEAAMGATGGVWTPSEVNTDTEGTTTYTYAYTTLEGCTGFSTLSLTVNSVCPLTLAADSLALVALYNATDGDNWGNNNNWLIEPLNTWYGVTLTSNGCNVAELNLGNNNLVGQIPPEMGNLDSLITLVLDSNTLSGVIPESLGGLENLVTLTLQNNALSGTIPESLGGLTSLDTLYLQHNEFTFDDFVNIDTLWGPENFHYAPQDGLISINNNSDGSLSVETTDASNNTYYWYEEEGTPIDTIVGDNLFIPPSTGTYYCEVVNSEVTSISNSEQNLILTSQPFTVKLHLDVIGGYCDVEGVSYLYFAVSSLVSPPTFTAEGEGFHMRLISSETGEVNCGLSTVGLDMLGISRDTVEVAVCGLPPDLPIYLSFSTEEDTIVRAFSCEDMVAIAGKKSLPIQEIIADFWSDNQQKTPPCPVATTVVLDGFELTEVISEIILEKNNLSESCYTIIIDSLTEKIVYVNNMLIPNSADEIYIDPYEIFLDAGRVYGTYYYCFVDTIIVEGIPIIGNIPEVGDTFAITSCNMEDIHYYYLESLSCSFSIASDCYSDSTGTIAIELNGGAPPYKVYLTNGTSDILDFVVTDSTQASFENINLGTYFVNVVDNLEASCSSDTIVIEDKAHYRTFIENTEVEDILVNDTVTVWVKATVPIDTNVILLRYCIEYNPELIRPTGYAYLGGVVDSTNTDIIKIDTLTLGNVAIEIGDLEEHVFRIDTGKVLGIQFKAIEIGTSTFSICNSAGIWEIESDVEIVERCVENEELIINVPLINSISTTTIPSLVLYPNPFEDILNIKAANVSVLDGMLSIYNSLGEEILFNESIECIDLFNAKINLENIPSGVYFLHIVLQEGLHMYQKKIVKL